MMCRLFTLYEVMRLLFGGLQFLRNNCGGMNNREVQTNIFMIFGNSEIGKVGSSELLPTFRGPDFSGPFSLEKMDLWDGGVDCLMNSCKIRIYETIRNFYDNIQILKTF